MCGDRFSSSTTCSRWRHETEPGRLDQSLSCRFWKVATHPFWELSGSDHTAYVKPLEAGVVSNVALVCASGRVYPFWVTETSDRPPHLVVRVTRAAAPGSVNAHAPAFAHRRVLDTFEAARATAAAETNAICAAATGTVARVQAAATAAVLDFRDEYPARLRFRYDLDPEAMAPPFLVSAMWDDGQFTYVKSAAQEAPALYELKDEAPSLVAYDLTEDGLYIARHVLEDGWLQIGEQQAGWVVETPRRRQGRFSSPLHRALTAAALVVGSFAVWTVTGGGS